MTKVDNAINKILAENEYFLIRDGFIFFKIQDIARKIHPHYWKYRDRILKEIHEWAKQHPTHSEWTDKKGRKYRVGYGEQMHLIYGSFKEKGNANILELIRWPS